MLNADSFNENLRDARVAAKLTQGELGARIGLRRQEICRYERTHRLPSLRVLCLLANALGVSTDSLLRP